jgi:RNA polymerase sigma-70 factor, ECF subfamily
MEFEADYATFYASCQEPLMAFLQQLGLQPVDAEDLFHETMVRALRDWEKIRRSHKGAQIVWLRTVARNLVITRSRRKATHELSLEDHEPTGTLTEDAEKNVRSSHVREALRALPLPARRALYELYWNGYSNDEAATLLGVPLGTFKSQVSRAKARLRSDPTLRDP